MDIATLSAVINQLDKQAELCRKMLSWAIEHDDKEYELMWAHSLTQAQKALSAVETMLENEIAYREAA